MLTGDWAEAAIVVHEYGASIKEYFDQDHNWFQTTVLSVFAILNSIRVIAYVPQVVKAARDENGASAISFTTWSLFFFSHLTTILYAIVCQGDLLMALIFLGNAVACMAIVGVTLFKRRAAVRRYQQSL